MSGSCEDWIGLRILLVIAQVAASAPDGRKRDEFSSPPRTRVTADRRTLTNDLRSLANRPPLTSREIAPPSLAVV